MGARLSALARCKLETPSEVHIPPSQPVSEDEIDALFYQSLIRCLTSTTDPEVVNGNEDPLQLSQLGQVTAMVLQEIRSEKLDPARHDQKVFIDVCEQAHEHLFAHTAHTTDQSVLNKMLTRPPVVAQEQTDNHTKNPATDTRQKKNLLSRMFEAGRKLFLFAPDAAVLMVLQNAASLENEAHRKCDAEIPRALVVDSLPSRLTILVVRLVEQPKSVRASFCVRTYVPASYLDVGGVDAIRLPSCLNTHHCSHSFETVLMLQSTLIKTKSKCG